MDKVYLERPSVGELLRGHIRNYKKLHTRLSGAQIARRFGVSTSSLNRIENGDIRTPTIEQAVKILRATCNAEEVADFMRTYYPEIHHGLLDYFKSSSERVQLEEDVEKYFCDESTYMMMLFATTRKGLSENWVLQEYGRTGHQKFMKLAARGVLVNRDGRFFASDKDVEVGAEGTLRTIQFIAKQSAEIVLATNEIKGIDAEIKYESVNYEKIQKELKTLVDDFRFEVRSLLNKEENIGKDLLYVGSFFKLVRD